MKKKRWMIAAAALLVCLGVGCRSSKSEESPVSEDKRLVVYTSHKEEVYGPIIREFEERTGIWVDVRAGGTTELLNAIREGGEGVCDVMFGGGVESLEAYRECFEPYRCRQKELMDQEFVSPEDDWTAFSELPIVFIYNHKLVLPENAPESWAELITDKWKGQIAFADTRKSGTSYTILATMIQALGADEEQVLEAFAAALDGNISAGSGEVVSEVSSGKRLVGITLEETARKKIRQGADISMAYPKEGTSAVPDGTALVKGAPHPDNARLFIDFTVSEDVQQLLVDQFLRRPVRQGIRQDEEVKAVKLLPFDLDWAGMHQDRILSLWQEIMEREQ